MNIGFGFQTVRVVTMPLYQIWNAEISFFAGFVFAGGRGGEEGSVTAEEQMIQHSFSSWCLWRVYLNLLDDCSKIIQWVSNKRLAVDHMGTEPPSLVLLPPCFNQLSWLANWQKKPFHTKVIQNSRLLYLLKTKYYINELDNRENRFSETYSLPGLTHDERENLKSPITTKEIDQ